MIPKTETNALPSSKSVGEQIQIDFAGPFVNEKRKKRFIVLAVDNLSRWPFASVCKACNLDSALEILGIDCENIGLPSSIKVDNASAFKSKNSGNSLKRKE